MPLVCDDTDWLVVTMTYFLSAGKALGEKLAKSTDVAKWGDKVSLKTTVELAPIAGQFVVSDLFLLKIDWNKWSVVTVNIFKKTCCNYLKITTMWFYYRVICPKNADGVTNGIDPGQTFQEHSDLCLYYLPRPVFQKLMITTALE